MFDKATDHRDPFVSSKVVIPLVEHEKALEGLSLAIQMHVEKVLDLQRVIAEVERNRTQTKRVLRTKMRYHRRDWLTTKARTAKNDYKETMIPLVQKSGESLQAIEFFHQLLAEQLDDTRNTGFDELTKSYEAIRLELFAAMANPQHREGEAATMDHHTWKHIIAALHKAQSKLDVLPSLHAALLATRARIMQIIEGNRPILQYAT